MIQTVSQRLQTYFGWCPNHPGVYVQAVDLTKGQVALKNTDPEPPQPGTTPAQIVTPPWMTIIALAILVATFFVGGNIWWPAIVLVILVIFVIIHLRALKNTGEHL